MRSVLVMSFFCLSGLLIWRYTGNFSLTYHLEDFQRSAFASVTENTESFALFPGYRPNLKTEIYCSGTGFEKVTSVENKHLNKTEVQIVEQLKKVAITRLKVGQNEGSYTLKPEGSEKEYLISWKKTGSKAAKLTIIRS